MWLSLAFLSALLLGFYDVAKKQALKGNAVPVVLLLNTLFSTLLFSPVLLSSELTLELVEVNGPPIISKFVKLGALKSFPSLFNSYET